jgi:hypothetical protein
MSNLFRTNYTVPADTPIVALSDIHADIDGLIITLRDCAKVIKKNEIAESIDINMHDDINANIIDVNYAIENAYKIYDIMFNNRALTYEQAKDLCLSQIPHVLVTAPTDLIIKTMRCKYYDIVLESFLHINLDSGITYFDDLGYEWIGNNTHVVIVGDILDGLRSRGFNPITPKKINMPGTPSEFINQYYQVEVKILKFLNMLDIYAENIGGRVIKLIGNHELLNFYGVNLESYAFGNINNTIYDDSYYHGLSRDNYFLFNNEGFNLFKERGTGIILKINNNVFVHGSLVEKPTHFSINYSEINTLVNTPQQTDTLKNALSDFSLDKNGTFLWTRTDGDDIEATKRISANSSGTYCQDLESRLKYFCNKIDPATQHQNIRLIVGHCPQSYSLIPAQPLYLYATGKPNTQGEKEYGSKQITFSNYLGLDDTNVNETYESGSYYTGHTNPTQNMYFGITTECENTNYQVFRIDIGQSRGFDNHAVLSRTTEEAQKNFLFSRTPQVLFIVNNNLKIIRSLWENTRKHQPRDWFENYNNTQGNPSFVGGFYNYKYNKYYNKMKQINKN